MSAGGDEGCDVEAEGAGLGLEVSEHFGREAGLAGEDPEEAAIGGSHHGPFVGAVGLPS